MLLSILTIFCAFGVHSIQAQLPSGISRCKSGDVTCISNEATKAIKTYSKGASAANIPSFDPFKVERLVIDENNNEQVALAIDLSNIVVEGLSKTVVERTIGFTKNPRTSKFEMFARTSKLKLTGNYKANGRILVVPVRGEGRFTLLLNNVKISVKFKPKITTKEGKSYLGVDKIKVLVEPEKAQINLDNIQNRNSSLGESINEFINQNWREVWKELYPSVNRAFVSIVKNLIQRPLSMVPYEELFID